MINKTLIILPGWGGSQETWADFVALAKKEITDVHVLDLPCFGATACPKTVWGVQHYAEYVKRKVARLEQQNIVLLGHSFGGQVATYLVANNPTICEKLVLSGAAVYRPKKYMKRLVFRTIAEMGKIFMNLPGLAKFRPLAQKALYKVADSPDYSETNDIKREIYRKIIRQDMRHELLNISVETLVVWGEKDSYTPLRYGKKIANAIPNAHLKVIEGGTHGLHLKKKESLLQIIKDFVQ